MKVDLEKFRDEGYLIVEKCRAARSPAGFAALGRADGGRGEGALGSRAQRGRSARGRLVSGRAARLGMDSITAETADVLDFCLGETTKGVSEQLLNNPPFIALTTFGALCSGLIDYGHTDWHRDASSAEQAPLSGMQLDLVENGPGYVQWNIALYDDDVFWILPKSHKQPTTEAQWRQLLLDPTSPLEGGIPAELKAGDGIVYPNLMMHWGSTYTSRLRRTIHMGYRSFGAPILPYIHQLEWHNTQGFLQYASDEDRAHFAEAEKHYDREREQIEAQFRAMIAGDERAYRDGLAALHPGEVGRMVSAVLMCRIANKVVKLHRSEIAGMAVEERRPLIDGSPPAYYAEDMARRFTADEAGVLEQRLAELNRRLEQDRERSDRRYAEIFAELRPEAENLPAFESRPLRTFNSEMPEGFGVDEFIASWGA